MIPASRTSFVTNGGVMYESFWYSLRDESDVIFKVTACREAHVTLTSFTQNAQARNYEILLGTENNMASKIGRGSVDAGGVRVATPGILNCDSERYFWISWSYQSAIIEVGRGMVPGEMGFMNLRDTEEPYDIRAMSIGTPAGVSGVWQFGSTKGIHMSLLQN